MSHLFDLLPQLQANAVDDCTLPHYLLGSFRRKSISFFNGLTDEHSLVYWFQSRSFSIDLRLSHPQHTPISERQGWIGQTLWNAQTAQLSWDIQQSYQTRLQWPEPATLEHIGNCVLEFPPSKAYVEDWRQQASAGLFLGLRLSTVENILSKEQYAMEGGLIITGQHMAYVQSRFPEAQKKCQHFEHFATALSHGDLTEQEVNGYETSISLQDGMISLSTITSQVGKLIDLNGFERLNERSLRQKKWIQGIEYFFYYDVDVYLPHYPFMHSSTTTSVADQWTKQEQKHLFKHAKIVC